MSYTTPSRPPYSDAHRPRTGGSNPQRRESAPKGHDSVLRALQNDARQITVTLMSGERLVGKVVGRDKFTITVMTAEARHVIYKHAIESFFGEEREQRQSEQGDH